VFFFFSVASVAYTFEFLLIQLCVCFFLSFLDLRRKRKRKTRKEKKQWLTLRETLEYITPTFDRYQSWVSQSNIICHEQRVKYSIDLFRLKIKFYLASLLDPLSFYFYLHCSRLCSFIRNLNEQVYGQQRAKHNQWLVRHRYQGRRNHWITIDLS
jgi:hypothetical protein